MLSGSLLFARDRFHHLPLPNYGNATQVGVLRKLAKIFGLPKWEARLDDHYLTGEALETFYNLD
jgi:hypothetical protein